MTTRRKDFTKARGWVLRVSRSQVLNTAKDRFAVFKETFWTGREQEFDNTIFPLLSGLWRGAQNDDRAGFNAPLVDQGSRLLAVGCFFSDDELPEDLRGWFEDYKREAKQRSLLEVKRATHRKRSPKSPAPGPLDRDLQDSLAGYQAFVKTILLIEAIQVARPDLTFVTPPHMVSPGMRHWVDLPGKEGRRLVKETLRRLRQKRVEEALTSFISARLSSRLGHDASVRETGDGWTTTDNDALAEIRNCLLRCDSFDKWRRQLPGRWSKASGCRRRDHNLPRGLLDLLTGQGCECQKSCRRGWLNPNSIAPDVEDDRKGWLDKMADDYMRLLPEVRRRLAKDKPVQVYVSVDVLGDYALRSATAPRGMNALPPRTALLGLMARRWRDLGYRASASYLSERLNNGYLDRARQRAVNKAKLSQIETAWRVIEQNA
jgi:hypothetical protein